MTTAVRTVVFDTKPYDRESLGGADGAVDWHFREYRLSADTAVAAKNARAVCIFVNDHADRAALEVLHSLGVQHVALRCAGFNSVDIDAAKQLGLSVTRVPGLFALCSCGARRHAASRAEPQNPAREQPRARPEFFTEWPGRF